MNYKLHVKAIVSGKQLADDPHIEKVMKALYAMGANPRPQFWSFHAGSVKEDLLPFFEKEHNIKLSDLPVIQFAYEIESGKGKTITQVNGRHTIQFYEALYGDILLSSIGPDGEFRTGTGREVNRGIIPAPSWLPGALGIDMPVAYWGVIGAIGAIQTIRSDSGAGKVLWGSLSAYSAVQYFK